MGRPKKRNTDEKEMFTLAVKRAYDHIRDMAIDFSLRPNGQINEIEIAGLLEMSRVPVREALNRLCTGGFVTFDSGKGFSCRKFSETEMRELYGVRFDIEMGTVRQACNIKSEDSISGILADWERIAETLPDMSYDELILLDESFHIRIADISGNNERIGFLQNVFERTRFVRKISVEKESRRSSFVQEHISLAKAILRHDAALATELLERHLGANSDELEENIHTGMLRIYADDIR